MALVKQSPNRINTDLNLYPFYRAERYLAKNRGCEDRPFIRVEENSIPSFQLALSTSSTFELKIYQKDGTLVQTINNTTLQNYVFESTDTLNDYLVISTDFNNDEISSLAPGDYYLRLDVDGTIYYGEDFNVTSALVDQTCGTWYKLSWYNNCLEYDQEFFSDTDVERHADNLMIEFSGDQLQTEYEYQEEGIENGKGVFKSTYKRQVKKYTLKVPVPYYAIGAMEFIQLAEVVELTDNFQLTAFQLSNIEVEINPDFDQACYQLMTMTFEMGENRGRSVYNAKKCCDVDIYTGTVVEDLVNNECEVFIRGGCDFRVENVFSEVSDGGGGFHLDLTANAIDQSTGDTYTPSGTLTYTWYYANNTDCTCEELADTTQTIRVRDTGGTDDKGKYIVVVEDDGTGCRMSAQSNYEANCRNGDTIYTPDNPDCDLFSTELTYDATNKQLTSTAQNVPSGETASYEWYYTTNGTTTKLSDTSQTIGLSTNYGDYTSVVTAGDCQTRTTYTHTDECANFIFTKVVEGDSITYSPPSGYTSVTYAWVYIDDAGTRTNLGTTTSTHVAADSGYYEMTATDGDCTYINTSYLLVEDCTGKSVSISVTDNTLTATPTGFSGAETYAWYIDTGSGETSLSSTGTSHEATQTGNFIIKVTEGSCTEEANQVMIIDEECCDFAVSIAEDGPTLVATVSNPPATCDVEVKWYIWNGVNWVYKQTGLVHTPSNEGIFKAEVICGGCVAYDLWDYDV